MKQKSPAQIAIHVLEIQQLLIARQEAHCAYLRAFATMNQTWEKVGRLDAEIKKQEAAYIASLNQTPA